jgi:predicted heme/steroid binding protein
MDIEIYIKRMYGYFTEVNKKVNLIQWQYRNSSVMRQDGQVSVENTKVLPEENIGIVPVENTKISPIESMQNVPIENTEIPPSGNSQIIPIENTGIPQVDRVFTLEELKQYNGSNNNPAYIAVDGVVYDVSNIARWAGGSHFGVRAGSDATQDYRQCHGATGVVNRLPKIGVLQQ